MKTATEIILGSLVLVLGAFSLPFIAIDWVTTVLGIVTLGSGMYVLSETKRWDVKAMIIIGMIFASLGLASIAGASIYLH